MISPSSELTTLPESNLAAAFIALEQIYHLADQEIEAHQVQCNCCGQCCDFDHNGMRLYIYHIERLYLQHKRQGQGLVLQNGRCCAQQQSLCGIHSIRPLGCRTQFCSITLQEIYEKYAAQIKLLEQKYGILYAYSEAFYNIK